MNVRDADQNTKKYMHEMKVSGFQGSNLFL